MKVSDTQQKKILAASNIVEHGDMAVLVKILEMQDFLESYEKDSEEMKTVLSKIEDFKKYCDDMDMTSDSKIGEATSKLQQLVSKVEENLTKKIADSDNSEQIKKITDKFSRDLENLKSLIPIMPDLSIYEGKLSELEAKIPVFKETVLDTPDELVEKVIKSEKKLPQSKIEGLQKDINDIRGIAASNSLPITTMFVNGKRAKNLSITGATVNVAGDTANITVTGGGSGSGGSTFIDQTPDNGTYGALAGLVNSSNTVFTVSQGSYITGFLQVYRNGLLQLQGASDDWQETTPASGTFTFNTAPTTGDIITVVYQTSLSTTGEFSAGTNVTITGTGTALDPYIINSSGGGGGTPGGSTTQLQYNNAGAFDGITGATTDGTSVTLTSPTLGGTPTVSTLRAIGSGGVEIQNNSGTSVITTGAGGGTGTSLQGTTNIGSASADYIQVSGGTGASTFTATGSSSNIDVTLTPKGTGSVRGNRFVATGTAGNGYVELTEQSSKPGTPTNATRLYSDASNRLSWIGENGYVRTFDGTANTADRVYILPDLDGTVALGGSEALTSDVTTTSVTAVDTNLSFAAAANTTYLLTITGTASKATSTTGLKLGIGAPSGSTIKGQQQQGGAAGSTAMTNSLITAINSLGATFATGTGVEVPFRIEATVTTSSTPGNCTLQFATVTSNTATIYAGSRMSWQVATLV